MEDDIIPSIANNLSDDMVSTRKEVLDQYY